MLGKPRGEMGMTWKFKVQRGAFALAIVGALALASGANFFTDNFFVYLFNFFT
jgi:hypothetical protein